MKIIVNGIPPSLNQFAGRENSWAYRDAKETWTNLVAYLARNHPDRPKEPYPFASVTIRYFFPDRRRRDPDNYCGKFLLDGLTKAGIITDDDFRHIRLSVSGECDPRSPRTEITVEKEKRTNANDNAKPRDCRDQSSSVHE